MLQTRTNFPDLNGVLGNYATLGLNIADFSRYANKPSAQNVQAIVIPAIFSMLSLFSHIELLLIIPTAVVGLLGIFTAAAAETAYGKVLWNPIDIINHWMDSGSHGGRAAAAFAAIGLIIVTLGINISANSISAANDLMSFCPKYINIRRGQVLAAFIGSWGFVPVSIPSPTGSQRKLTIAVENSCFGRQVPRIPGRLHYLPGSHDGHINHRVGFVYSLRGSSLLTWLQLLHCPPRERVRSRHVQLPWHLQILAQVRQQLACRRCLLYRLHPAAARLRREHCRSRREHHRHLIGRHPPVSHPPVCFFPLLMH